MLISIGHGFSFPVSKFESNGLFPDRPTDEEDTYVDFVRKGVVGSGAEHTGNARRWRLTAVRAGAKSVFHFDVPGAVAKSTHAGLPWLLFIRQRLVTDVHFWPFDGWEIPAGCSAIVEVYPKLWRHSFPRGDLTPDQHDAYCIVAWLSQADRNGSLAGFLNFDLAPSERTQAQIAGWILGVK